MTFTITQEPIDHTMHASHKQIDETNNKMTREKTTTTSDPSLEFLRMMRQKEMNDLLSTRTVSRRLQNQQSTIMKLPSASSVEKEVEHLREDMDFFQWRHQMAQWIFRTASCCEMTKQTAEVAIRLMDQYTMTCWESQNDEGTTSIDKEHYQLGCMASLYMVSKIHEKRCMTSELVEQLSGGLFSKQQIEEMEMKLLFSLTWKLNPPTATVFAHSLLNCIPAPMIPDYGAILELLETQIELAMGSKDCFSIDASRLASAALLNSLQSTLPHGNLAYFRYRFAMALNLDMNSFQSGLEELQEHLFELVMGSRLPAVDDNLQLDKTNKEIGEGDTERKVRQNSVSSYSSSPSSVTVTTCH